MLSYYALKIRSRLLTRHATPLIERRTGKGLLAGNLGDFNFQGKIVLYFADAQLIHLGDQLFHQPLIEFLRDRFEVIVATHRSFDRYFAVQGLKTVAADEYAETRGAIIISKEDAAHSVSKLFPSDNYFIGLSYSALPQNDKIVLTITKLVCEIMTQIGIDLPPLPSEESSIYQPIVPTACLEDYESSDWVGQVAALPGDRLLAYNDFVNSNMLDASRRRYLLHEIARKKKSEGYEIVYVGSEKERRQSPSVPDFVDLDLRGRHDAAGLYKFFSLDNVKGIITFDTFAMHVASASRKDLYVVIRKADEIESYRRKFIPMFPNGEELVRVLV